MSIAHASRHALVIGNAEYATQGVLRNPVNDARLIGESLRKIGFQVAEITNADQIAMLSALSKFRERTMSADVAVIYFSGHGMKHLGEQQNYLLPIDMPDFAASASINSDIVLQSKAVAESILLDAMAGAKYQLLILDACRDNATGSKSGSKGLIRRQGVGSGRLIAYATEENKVARDGTERNSPYAQSLSRLIVAPDFSIVQALDAVADEVKVATRGAQSPTKTGDLAWNVGFNGSVVSGQGRAQALAPESSEEARAWQAAQTANTTDAYRSFVAAFPQGVYRAAANLALSLLQPTIGGLQLSSNPPKLGSGEAGRIRLLDSFDFQGPLGRTDRTLLAFDGKDENIGVIGVADGGNARSPIEIRAVSRINAIGVRGTAERMSWQTDAALMSDGRTLRTMSSTWGAIEEFELAQSMSEALATRRVRLNPKLTSNGTAALNSGGELVVVNMPCASGSTAKPARAGDMIERAGRWSVTTGKCLSTLRLMVDQESNPVIQFFATDAAAQWLAYRYRYGSGDLFVQPITARSPAEVKRIPRALAPQDSSGRTEFDSAALSPGGQWVAGWTGYGPRTLPQGFVPVFATRSDQALQIVVPGRRVHRVLFASDELVVVASSSGETAAPLHIGLYELPSARMVDRLVIEGVARVHGATISASGKRFALGLLSTEESKIVHVAIFELR